MAAAVRESGERTGSVSQRSWLPLAFASACGSIAIATLAIAYPFIKPGFRKICLPFVPATDDQVVNVVTALKKLNLKPTHSSVIDLGSGDGRLVIASAKLGYKSTGVELNPWLVYWSRLMARKQKVPATFIKGDLFSVNLSSYDVIIVFGVDSLMPALSEMFSQVKHRRLNVIACRFPLPNTCPRSTIGRGVDTVWIYDVPSRVNNT